MELEDYHLGYRLALEVATRYHEGQRRKYSSLPYIVHPVRVANLLQRFHPVGEDLEEGLALVQVALLHDTLEDTQVSQEEIGERFGALVLADILSLTKPPGASETSISSELEERLGAASPRARRVKLADRYDNLLDARSDFSAEKLRRYLGSSNRIQRICAPASPALAAELAALIEALS